MPRLRVPGDRKTAICDALLRLAASEGIAALTMERLGRELGVTSGALFRHFPTREAMLDAAANRLAGLLLGALPPADLLPIDRIRLFFLGRLRMITDHPGIPQLVFSEQFAKALPPAGARALRSAIGRSVDFLVEAVKDAAGRNDVRSDVPPHDLAMIVMGVLLSRGLFSAHAGRGPKLPPPEEAWLRLSRVLSPPGALPPGLTK